MKLLVLGTGGREHALAWRLAQQVGSDDVYLHPGNAATRGLGLRPLGEISLADREAIVLKARTLGIELVLIGPEALLAEGYADYLRAEGFLVVGPGKSAARLETSKAFAKYFMERANIPTAPFFVVGTAAELERRLGEHFPVVLKLDGLAAGKGVVIAKSRDEAKAFSKRVWQEGEFGAGPHEIVVETFLPGRELSCIGLCDGHTFVPLSSATDFKRVGDGDTGPNTGGMGAISPSPYASAVLDEKIKTRLAEPMLRQLRAEGLEFRGILYFGIMISPSGEPSVLEFNVRFGDPETQALMLRLEGDFPKLLEHTARGTLSEAPPPKWKKETAIYVVASAHGYPTSPRSGDLITGLDGTPRDTEVFFSGVSDVQGHLVTQGGRVLGVGALGMTPSLAREKVYAAMEKIQFDGMHYRRDIGEVI